MTTTNTLDAARVELLLSELRLPGIKLIWAKLAEQSDKEGWPAARFLAALAEHEMADRGRRRIERECQGFCVRGLCDGGSWLVPDASRNPPSKSRWPTRAGRRALSRPLAAGGGGRRPAFTGPAVRLGSGHRV